MFSDQPIKDSKTDLFGRKKFSKRISHIIANRTQKESVVIGIHAPWGEGKTSVLNMIIEGLEESLHKKNKTLLNGHIVLLKFNPWIFSDENQLLEHFFHALADKLEGRIETKGEKVSDLVRNYSWVSAPLEAVKINLFGVANASLRVEETLKKFAEAKPKADVFVLKERIEKILDESDKKIVVVMDDIDRLDKAEIQSIFRLVKLSADFPNTIYILSFDVERVSEALAEKYGSGEAGRSFLEKIIQLSLPLPPLTSIKLIKLTFDEINKLLSDNQIELSQDDESEWGYFFSNTFGVYLKSPRLVKKYINNLWFSMPETKDELNILDLLTIEAVHTFFPNLYEIIRNNKNVFLLEPSNLMLREYEEKEHIKTLKTIIEKFSEQERKVIEKIIQKLFPRTSGAFGNSHYGTSWYDAWEREKRIASPNYFQRYFDFGVSDDDVSDIELKQFIENLITRTEKKNASEIKKLVSNNREELFLQKISLLADNLEEDKAIKLAKAITLSSELFPKANQDSILLGWNAFSNAARLLRHLVESITDENRRLEIAIELASTAPLDFAYEYFRFARYIGRNSNESEDKEELTELAQAVINKIVERVEIEAKREILEIRYPQYSANLYRAWLSEKPESVKEYLRKRFAESPKDSENFIISFRKQSWDVNGTARLWGLDFIISAIEELHPDIKLPTLENYTNNSSYLPESEQDYLIYFMSIAKRISSYI